MWMYGKKVPGNQCRNVRKSLKKARPEISVKGRNGMPDRGRKNVRKVTLNVIKYPACPKFKDNVNEGSTSNY